MRCPVILTTNEQGGKMNEEKRIEKLTEKIKAIALSMTNDELIDGIKEIFTEAKEAQEITEDEFNLSIAGLRAYEGLTDETSAEDYLNIYHKLPEESQTSLLLASVMFLIKALHEEKKDTEL